MTSPWRYDTKSRRYRNTKTGRYLGPEQMRELRDAFHASLYEDANSIAARLARKEITLNQGLDEARLLVNATQIDNYVMARGGRKRMTSKSWGWVGSQIKEQHRKYLQPFFEEIAKGTISEAQAARRLRMYVDAGKQAYMMGEREAAKDAGNKQERNVLSAVEHCPGCVAQTQRGWVKIGELVPLTQRTCLTNDKCSIEYR